MTDTRDPLLITERHEEYRALIQKYKERVKELNKAIRALQVEYDKLEMTVGNQQREINRLKYRIAELESKG